jgi:hypothetical protein
MSEMYKSWSFENQLDDEKDKIQCIVSNLIDGSIHLERLKSLNYGIMQIM